MILAIDPGPEQSGLVLYANGVVRASGVYPNGYVIGFIEAGGYDLLAVEMVASYGMAVGAEVFETCVVIGRFLERAEAPARKVYRRDVKLHLCGNSRAKDANIRQALIDKFGPGKEAAIGRKASPGPLYAVKSHAWSALAVAVTADETEAA